jgi:hypothetical protein
MDWMKKSIIQENARLLMKLMSLPKKAGISITERLTESRRKSDG